MKFQSIIHYLLLIVVVMHGDAQQQMTGRLTPEENAERLRTCGTEMIREYYSLIHLLRVLYSELPADDRKPVQTTYRPRWLLLLSGTKWSLGTMISSRHFLTSSEVVITDDKNWKVGGHAVSAKCIDGHLEVPTGFFQNAKFHKLICQNSNCTWIDKPVARAVILNYCTIAPENWNKAQAVMVVEIEVDPERSWPCLVDNIAEKTVASVHMLDILTLVGNSNNMEHRRLNIFKTSKEFLELPQYHEINHRGSPILWVFDDKRWLIGLGAGGSKDTSYGLKVSNLEKELCDVVGVCGSAQILVAPPTTQAPPPAEIFIPTENQTQEPIPVPTPVTAGTPSKTVEAPPPPKPSTEAPPPAPPAKRREDDETDNDDYETFLKRKKEKEEAEMYENEDTDILISKDDFNDCDGRRAGLRITLLCFFSVLLVFV
ncbi:hypothetical protein CRE_23153 [Caenorhabditis remanei]|uniref:Peptidase S1 domain-containing protein n=1 Tax=Caenorhabditis remanei TaxID=31234 RepID=E3NFX5_CAERE|nr:hypothetical protein CRE_23153 [Caenorhabditis remanei]